MSRWRHHKVRRRSAQFAGPAHDLVPWLIARGENRTDKKSDFERGQHDGSEKYIVDVEEEGFILYPRYNLDCFFDYCNKGVRWRNLVIMDIPSLKLFITLSRNLHFGKTSEEMHMSPSAVSRALQRLEDQLGHSLLVRDNRSAQLTEGGQVFLEYALEMVKRWEALQRDLKGKSAVLRGQLTLFASVTASQSILPAVLSEFRKQYPKIHI